MFKSFKNLSKFELRLWLASLAVILISALLGGRENLPSALCSAVGVTALIFVAKGDVLGQVLTIVFALGYGAISLTFAYYGEMITYVFMSAPMALLAVIAWLRHPYKPDESEVNRLPLTRVSCTRRAASRGVFLRRLNTDDFAMRNRKTS